MSLPDLDQLQRAATALYRHMPPSPQINWPLLSQRLGCEAWVKHENHNPTGAFKVRGGLIYLGRLREREPGCRGIVSATRGNHGQSLAFAAALHGVRSLIVVPECNSDDKNRAMRAFGAELVVHGRDFDDAAQHAAALSESLGHHLVPNMHADLITGVGTCALELLRAQPDLSRIYVPIGLGSGICGLIAARRALGARSEIVGVVSERADCYARSLARGKPVATGSARTLADGMAVRRPNSEALAIMRGEVDRVVRVGDREVLEAIRIYFTDTHNVAEGAGAAGLAAALKERPAGHERIGLVLTGGNIDAALFARALAGG